MHKIVPIVLMLALLLPPTVRSHDWDVGWRLTCPEIPPMVNFTLDKFLGGWYVIQQVDTSSSCFVYNFTQVSDTQLDIIKDRDHDILSPLGVDAVSKLTGRLDIPNLQNAARMRLKWPTNVLGKSDFVVVDTDYVNFALIFDCQEGLHFTRKNAAVLSRRKSLDQSTLKQLKKQMLPYGFEDRDFEDVIQTDCIQDPDLALNINRSTLRNVARDAVDGIKGIASTLRNFLQVASGAASVFNSFSSSLGLSKKEETIVTLD